MLFFTAYQMDGEVLSVGTWSHTFDGIFSATAVLMISAWPAAIRLAREEERPALNVDDYRHHHIWCRHLNIADQRFIQWKPTVFNWVLALVFLGSHFIGQRPVLQRLAGNWCCHKIYGPG